MRPHALCFFWSFVYNSQILAICKGESGEKGNATYVLCMDHILCISKVLVLVHYWFLVSAGPDKDLLAQGLGI